MSEKMFMKAEEVAAEMDVSVAYAYKVIRKMNEDLKKRGCITISGRIDRKYFKEQFYATRGDTERSD